MYKENPHSVSQFEKLLVAIAVCEKRMKDVDDQLDDPQLELVVTDKEWEIISKDKLSEDCLKDLRQQ